MDKIISMKDIRLTLAAIAKRAEAGECFTVVRDSKPVFRIEPLGAEPAQKRDSVRDPGDAWGEPGMAMEIPEKVRKRLRVPQGAKIVFYEDADGHPAVRIAEAAPEFTPEEWARFLKKTEAEPVTRFSSRKELLRHLGKLSRSSK